MKMNNKETAAMRIAMAVLRECQETHDAEVGHAMADSALTDLLKALGLQCVVDEYEKVKKYYA